MQDGVRCPYCKKKLMEALHGTASIRCRHCKHLVSIVGEDFAHDDEVRACKLAVQDLNKRDTSFDRIQLGVQTIN